jgi:predicted dehydrogenase/aryl-alcohol dehydrogenase-like predicted oxidoreductase
MTTLKWGILGTGNIARKFAKGIAGSTTGTLVGVGSRTQEAADKFGEEYGAANRYGTYEGLLADPEVQAVYISLPNHLHAEWTIKCAEAGKHILCEKPFTTNHAEAMAVIEEVRRHGVFLLEAFMYRCHPQTMKLREIVASGVIGDIRLIQSSFCYNMGPQYENIRLSNPAAGGGIMDVGCYTTSLARLVAGGEPVEIKGTAVIGEISRVDEQATGSFKWANGCVANLACATQVGASSEARIWGSKGNIRIGNPWFPGQGDNVIVVNTDGKDEEVHVEGGNELYAIEADETARCVAAGLKESPAMTWADTLGNMAALDGWRKSIGLTFDAEKNESLAAAGPVSRPQPRMKYARIPGIDKDISRLVMGTMVANPNNMPYVCALFDHYVALGGNAFDTARVYGTEGLGAWMALRKNREQMVVIGKGAHPDHLGPRVTPEAITHDLELNLRDLQTDYLDMYLLHRDDPTQPVGPIVECLNEHHRAGRVKVFGGSNWTYERIQEANDYAKAHGLVPFGASSPNFSLASWNEARWGGCTNATSPEERAWYRETRMPLFSWSSQAEGFFTGRYSENDKSNSEMVRVWYNDANFERLRRVNELAAKKGVSGTQIACAYVLCQPFPAFALIGPRSIEETRTSADGMDVELTEDEMKWLNLEA